MWKSKKESEDKMFKRNGRKEVCTRGRVDQVGLSWAEWRQRSEDYTTRVGEVFNEHSIRAESNKYENGNGNKMRRKSKKVEKVHCQNPKAKFFFKHEMLQ